MGRMIGAVLAGAATWAVLWVSGTMALSAAMPDVMAAGQPVTALAPLLALIACSVVLSVLAGFITARIAKAQAFVATAWLSGLQLILGIGFEVSSWSLTPVWYHLVFLGLLVPAAMYGGKLGGPATFHAKARS
jgi:hypothetical protein